MVNHSIQLLMLSITELLEVLQTDKDALVILLHACLKLVNDIRHVSSIALSEVIRLILDLLYLLWILHHLIPHHLLLHLQLISECLRVISISG
jgi:hypothetical protein